MSQANVQQLRTWIAEQGLDVFLVMQLQNRTYLSGWFNEDDEGSGFLIVGQQEQIVLTHAFYREPAIAQAVGWDVTVIDKAQKFSAVFAELAKEHGWQKIGFESNAITYAEYARFQKALTEAELTAELVPFEQSVIETLRQVKQPYEVDLLRHAIEITDATFAHLCAWIQPGMTEKEIAFEVQRTMVALGADGLAFDTIVASGPNGSMPHAIPSDRQVQKGELITIDMGARYKGYCADMTRTICLGEPTEPRMREVYDAVLHAMKTCEAGLHAGISGKDGDSLAREALNALGLAEYYIHSTGHGVGLQIHEGPNLSQRAPDEMVLPIGSVVTIEPGVYIPGWSGVRVEDCGLVTEHGLEVLTKSPTELVIPR